MNEFLVTLISSCVPLAVSLITAIVGLIVTALKYKKQKYEIAILKEQNEFLENSKGALTQSEVNQFRSILKEINK